MGIETSYSGLGGGGVLACVRRDGGLRGEHACDVGLYDQRMAVHASMGANREFDAAVRRTLCEASCCFGPSTSHRIVS